MSALAPRLALAAALALPALYAGAVPVEPLDRGQLQALLAAKTPCSVIDARSEAERSKLGLAHALVYHQRMKIDPTGMVVVIADTDARALEIGEALVKTSAAKHVVAVKGGARTWVDAQQATAAGPAGALSFIIPTNTCEQGPPLQLLRTNRQ